MTNLKRIPRWWIVLAVVITALAVVGIAWILWPDDLPDQTASEAADSAESTVSVDADDTDTPPDTTLPDSTTGDSQTTTPGSDAPTSSERVPALVVEARTEGGTTMLSVDYIQFLTGNAAAVAAIERGDESPPPNDYYIVNDNARLREFAVQDGISVVTVVRDDGTADPGGYALPLNEWVALLNGPAGSMLKANFYWLTISGDTITTIEQQYLP